MSLRAAGNRATNDAEAGRQGLGRTLFSRMHDASLMSWSSNRACPLAFMQRDATKCNKMQHFWHFRGCCTVRYSTLEGGTRSRACRAALRQTHAARHASLFSSSPVAQPSTLRPNTTGCGSPTTIPQVMHHNASFCITFSIFFQLPSNAGTRSRAVVASFAIIASLASLSLSNARAQFPRSH